jgi:hypothetical protein
MRILVIAAFALTLLTGIAPAQYIPKAGDNSNTEADRADAEARQREADQKKEMEIDKAYKATIGKTKTPTAPRDPWATIR